MLVLKLTTSWLCGGWGGSSSTGLYVMHLNAAPKTHHVTRAHKCTTLAFAHLYGNQWGRPQMCRSGSRAEAIATACVTKGGFHQSVHIWLPAGTLQSHDLFIHSDKHQKERVDFESSRPGRVSKIWQWVWGGHWLSGQTVNTLYIFMEEKDTTRIAKCHSAHQYSVLRTNINRDKQAPSNCKDNFHLSSSDTCLWLLNCRCVLENVTDLHTVQALSEIPILLC